MTASTTRTNPNDTHNYNMKLTLKTSLLVKTGEFAPSLFRISLLLKLFAPQQWSSPRIPEAKAAEWAINLFARWAYLDKIALAVFLTLLLPIGYTKRFGPEILTAFSKFECWSAFLRFSLFQGYSALSTFSSQITLSAFNAAPGHLLQISWPCASLTTKDNQTSRTQVSETFAHSLQWIQEYKRCYVVESSLGQIQQLKWGCCLYMHLIPCGTLVAGYRL